MTLQQAKSRQSARSHAPQATSAVFASVLNACLEGGTLHVLRFLQTADRKQCNDAICTGEPSTAYSTQNSVSEYALPMSTVMVREAAAAAPSLPPPAFSNFFASLGEGRCTRPRGNDRRTRTPVATGE